MTVLTIPDFLTGPVFEPGSPGFLDLAGTVHGNAADASDGFEGDFAGVVSSLPPDRFATHTLGPLVDAIAAEHQGTDPAQVDELGHKIGRVNESGDAALDVLEKHLAGTPEPPPAPAIKPGPAPPAGATARGRPGPPGGIRGLPPPP